MVDSVTRVAMAWREIGLAVGEPPTTKGYPPSVFAALPRLLERAGNDQRGGITGLYTVLVDGDDFNEPVADAARSILDGHIVLTRKLASAGHYPAIDVLDSKSRVKDAVTTSAQREACAATLRCEASYRENEDLILVGAYSKGSDPRVDTAIQYRPQLLSYLQQAPSEYTSFTDTHRQLNALSARLASGAARTTAA
jgi:FliI/YscN family ATPase